MTSDDRKLGNSRMPLVFFCPSCDTKLRIATRKAGTQIACPKCAQLMLVPIPPGRVDPAAAPDPTEQESALSAGSEVQAVATDSDEVDDATEELPGQKPSETPADLTCPICKGMEKVRKVSKIVRQGTILGKPSNVDERVIQHIIDPDFELPEDEESLKKLPPFSQTSLARRLSPPAAPKKSAIRKWLMGFAVAAALIFGLAIIAAATDSGSTIIAVLFILAIMSGAVAFIISQKIPAIDEADQAKLAEWETEVSHWKTSYHCGRCDRTFVQ